jgi:PGF-CTERM protein
MKMSSDTKKAISVIFFYTALLFFLIGIAARLKESFHSRAEISTAGFTVAAVLVALGIITFLFSWRNKTDKPSEPPL